MKSGLNREWIVDKYYPPLTILRWEGNCVNRLAASPPSSSSLLLLLLLFNSRRLIARESFFFTRGGSKHRPRRQTVAGKTRMTAGISSRREIIRFLAPPARPPPVLLPAEAHRGVRVNPFRANIPEGECRDAGNNGNKIFGTASDRFPRVFLSPLGWLYERVKKD